MSRRHLSISGVLIFLGLLALLFPSCAEKAGLFEPCKQDWECESGDICLTTKDYRGSFCTHVCSVTGPGHSLKQCVSFTDADAGGGGTAICGSGCCLLYRETATGFDGWCVAGI